MKVNVEETCWTTTVDGKKIECDCVDCYMLAALHEPCLELGGLSYVQSDSIMADAKERFGDNAELPSWLDMAKEKLEEAELIFVKETTSGIHVGLTKNGLTVARRLQSHLNKYVPIMRLCDRMENPILSAIEWVKE